jgi:uncharacterized damage-inducible protein DinB
MDKPVLAALAEYNAYANRVLMETAAQAGTQGLEEVESPSRGSILGLIRHLSAVEAGYLAQLQGESQVVDRESLSTLEGIAALSVRTGKGFQEYVASADEGELLQAGDVKIGGQPFRFPPWQMLLQVFSHSAAHRGELSILLSEMGHPLPVKDMIVRFAEESGQGWPWE